MIVAIDGPAGAGKSTVARAVAQALGFTYLDTGAMYRCAALARLREPEVNLDGLQIELGEPITVNGEDVSEAIRSPEVTELASEVAAQPQVRAAMAERLWRRLGSGRARHRHRYRSSRRAEDLPDGRLGRARAPPR